MHFYSVTNTITTHTKLRVIVFSKSDDADDGSADSAALESLDEMLAVISSNELVPEVELIGHGNRLEVMAVLSQHNATIFQTIDGFREEPTASSQRPRRSPQRRGGAESSSDSRNQRNPFQLGQSPEDNNVRQPGKEQATPYGQLGGGGGTAEKNSHLGKLFPPLSALKVPWASNNGGAATTAGDRRVSAKENLQKFFGKLTPKKFTPKSQQQVDSLSKKAMAGGDPNRGRKSELPLEERVFRNRDNPRFPQEDVMVSMIDRRGDVNTKDYDYVEFADDVESERRYRRQERDDAEQRARGERPRKVTTGKSASSTATSSSFSSSAATAEDLGLWEMESHLKSPEGTSQLSTTGKQKQPHHSFAKGLGGGGGDEMSSYYGAPTVTIEDPSRNQHNNNPYSVYEMAASPHYYGGDDAEGIYQMLNYTTGGGGGHDDEEEEEYSARIRKSNANRRLRRDIFGGLQEQQHQPIEGAVQSLFQEIRDNYPRMLERLQEVVRPKRHDGNEWLIKLPGTPNIENLLAVNRGAGGGGFSALRRKRKPRSSSGFIRDDPAMNEIGYVPPAQLPIEFDPLLQHHEEQQTLEQEQPNPISSFFDMVLDSWFAFQQQLKGIFS